MPKSQPDPELDSIGQQINNIPSGSRNLATTLSERLRANKTKYLKLLATHLAWGEKSGVDTTGIEEETDS
ncbi:MAG: hypothetical protein KKH22_05535 [Proteobacteria bacterium]|nr:hypothetical protein [Pseudomonadota bacterium]